MKRILVMMLIAAMTVSMAACGKKNETTESTESNVVESESTTTESGEAAEESTESEVAEESTETEAETTDGETIGQTVLAAFKEMIAANPDMTAQEIADAIAAQEILPFGPMVMPVEPGFLMGFDADITGFEAAVQLSPMIGTIPFMSFVFTLADDADVEAFVKTLEDNANPAWNVCTEAEETIIEVSGQTVFFLMGPGPNWGEE